VAVTDHLLAEPSLSSEAAAPSACLGVFEREFDYLCATLRRFRVPSSDIEDLVHEVFMVMYRRWDTYESSYPLRPWLFGIAFRVAAAHRRRAWREIPGPWPELEDPSPGPEQTLATQQARGIVLAALDRLPLPRRAVFVMHYIDHMAVHDIASALSIPRFTAYSRLRKARQEFEAAVKRMHSGASQT
jgi:RNA polymerase sigma-70 factor (ECF subfamily)